MNDIEKYKDMIDLPHHVSAKHPQMSLLDRAAQFAPFAALTGYDASVNEAARYTEKKLVLDDDRKADIDMKLNMLEAMAEDSPVISVTYFKPDKKKPGGSYETVSGNFRRTDTIGRCIIFTDNRKISFSDIYAVEII